MPTRQMVVEEALQKAEERRELKGKGKGRNHKQYEVERTTRRDGINVSEQYQK